MAEGEDIMQWLQEIPAEKLNSLLFGDISDKYLKFESDSSGASWQRWPCRTVQRSGMGENERVYLLVNKWRQAHINAQGDSVLAFA